MQRPRKIKVEDVAWLLQRSTLWVREAMRREAIEIGTAMQLPGSTRWVFDIEAPKLAKFMGVSVAELWEMLRESESA